MYINASERRYFLAKNPLSQVLIKCEKYGVAQHVPLTQLDIELWKLISARQ